MIPRPIARTANAVLVTLGLASALPATAGTLADLHVVHRATGERVPVHQHDGKLWIAGNPGDRYAIQVVNKTGRRVLAVVSVDGVNVVSGETAHPDQTGYVFRPRQSFEITGWRKSRDEVAAFYFTALPDSYAARTDRPGNVGVIGLALFQEQAPPMIRPHPPIAPAPQLPGMSSEAPASRDGASGNTTELRSNAPAPASPAQAETRGSARNAPAGSPGEARAAERAQDAAPAQRLARERIGTGHGERERSVVSYTDFKRATSTPVETITLHYDRLENLVARGIVVGRTPVAEPRPFPGVPGFVPDPRG